MSDKANKKKPRAERLARMDGVTTYRDPRDGFGVGSAVDLSDQDHMAALVFVRRKIGEQPDPTDIGPECIETYFGSTQRHRHRLTRAYLSANRIVEEAPIRLIARRLAASLAAQMLAGVQFEPGHWAELAWIAHVRRATLCDLSREAFIWYQAELARAKRLFDRALRDVMAHHADERLEEWQRRRDERAIA